MLETLGPTALGIKPKLLTLAHKTLHCSLAPSSPSLTVPSACTPLHLAPASPASCSYSSPGALLGSPQLTHCISGTPALMAYSLSFTVSPLLSMVGILITPATWEHEGENRTASLRGHWPCLIANHYILSTWAQNFTLSKHRWVINIQQIEAMIAISEQIRKMANSGLAPEELLGPNNIDPHPPLVQRSYWTWTAPGPILERQPRCGRRLG